MITKLCVTIMSNPVSIRATNPLVEREEVIAERFWVHIPYALEVHFLEELQMFVASLFNCEWRSDLTILHHPKMVADEVQLRRDQIYEWISAYAADL